MFSLKLPVNLLALALLLGSSGCAQATDTSQAKIPIAEIKTFSQVFALIKSDYVDPSSDKKLMDGAIAGMVSSLDPHSTYLSPKEWKEMQVFTNGKFGGLGIEVTPDHGLLRVVAPIDGTPAAKAGIKAGDLIIKINDKSVQGMGLQTAIDEMRGKPGSQVRLTLIRAHSATPLNLTLTRAIIKVQSVREQLLAPGIGYLRISQFQDNTGNAVRQALAQLRQENHGPLRGLILDLRNNPGGVLQAGVETADAFLDHGLIVYTKGRTSNSNMRFRAHGPDLIAGTPMVVLINGGTASAAEIVTGALKDDGRALILGSRSFGKGSVQSVIPLDNGGAVTLTTALYYTPAGCSIQGQGIVPNVAITPSNSEEKNIAAALLKESELQGALQAPDPCRKARPQYQIPEPPAPVAKPANPGAVKESKDDIDPDHDFSLRMALDILQGKPVPVEEQGHVHDIVIPLPTDPAMDKTASRTVKAA